MFWLAGFEPTTPCNWVGCGLLMGVTLSSDWVEVEITYRNSRKKVEHRHKVLNCGNINFRSPCLMSVLTN